MLLEIQPVMSTLENVYNEVETKYRSVKKQQETIAEKLCEASTEGVEELMEANQQLGEKLIKDLRNCQFQHLDIGWLNTTKTTTNSFSDSEKHFQRTPFGPIKLSRLRP